MEPTRPAYVAVNVTMPQELRRRMDIMAGEGGFNRSELIRIWISRAWIERQASVTTLSAGAFRADDSTPRG